MSPQSSPFAPPGSLPAGQESVSPSGPSGSRWRRWRGPSNSTLGRVFVVALGLNLVVRLLDAAAPGWLRTLDSAGTVVLVVALGYLLWRVLGLLQSRLLWRVRRRLVLSYVLIGFVPIVPSVLFFLLGGLLLVGTVTSSQVELGFDALVDDAADLVAVTVVDLRKVADPVAVRAVLERRIRGVEGRYPSASLAVVTPAEDDAMLGTAGSWGHTTEPPGFPGWLAQEGSGIVLTGSPGRRTVVARAAAVIEVGGRVVAVVADVPLADDVIARM